MDFIRTAYTVQMKLWSDRDETATIRWYRADDTAELFGRHRYGSRRWESDQSTNGSVGEIGDATRSYYKGQNWLNASGLHSCGDKGVAERGGVWATDPHFPVDEIGWSECCGDPRPYAGHPDTTVALPQLVTADGGDVVAEGGLDVFTLTVQGYNTPISVLAVETLQFDDFSGPFIVEQFAPGVARVRLTPAHQNIPGVVANQLQEWRGEKRFLNDVWMGSNLLFGAWGMDAYGIVGWFGGSTLSVGATDGTVSVGMQYGPAVGLLLFSAYDSGGARIEPTVQIGGPAPGGATTALTENVAGLQFYAGWYVGGALVVPPASGGTGITGPFPNGSLLIGSGSTWGIGTISAGSGISVTNGPGSVSISSTSGSFASVSKWSVLP